MAKVGLARRASRGGHGVTVLPHTAIGLTGYISTKFQHRRILQKTKQRHKKEMRENRKSGQETETRSRKKVGTLSLMSAASIR